MTMDLIYADSDVEACKKFLLSEGANTLEDMQLITTYAEMQDFVFNQDHAIAAMATSDKPKLNAEQWWPYPANFR